jgi:hypothetical protein
MEFGVWGFCWRSGKFMDDFICAISIRRDIDRIRPDTFAVGVLDCHVWSGRKIRSSSWRISLSVIHKLLCDTAG